VDDPSGLIPSRVAEIVVTRKNGELRRGSGYLVTPSMVLTAWHVVERAKSVRIGFQDGPGTSRGADGLRWEKLSGDLAVIEVGGCEDLAPTRTVWGGFGTHGVVADAVVAGFPAMKLRSKSASEGAGKFRERMFEKADIAAGSDPRGGGMTVRVSPPASRAIGEESPWAGLSGGPVFCRNALVGVITDDFPDEGLERLAAHRVDSALAELSPEWRVRLGAVEIKSLLRRPGGGTRAAFDYQIQDVAPADGLMERDAELQELAEFCAGDEAYGWWQAPYAAGKTALMATFALDPPDGVVVVSFFVTARRSGHSDSNAFTEAMLEQLAALTGEEVPDVASPAARDAHRSRLLAQATKSVAEAGHRLVLLVDGIDEDTGAHSGSGLASIASLLPKHVEPSLKVIISGRPDRGLPLDVRREPDHPLMKCRPRTLTPSPFARGEVERAAQELGDLVEGPEPALDVMAFVAASGGGLTITDLADLLRPVSTVRIRQFLDGPAGRTIAIRHQTGATEFTHEALSERADQLFGPAELARYRERINAWADGYAAAGWAEDTPGYLLRGYQQKLFAEGDAAQLAKLASDQLRHDRMLERFGGDYVAVEEVSSAIRAIARTPAPDVVALIRLVRRREDLEQRSDLLPELPALWARLGDLSRAEALARSIAEPSVQAQALAGLVQAIASRDLTQAGRIAETAHKVAYAVTDRTARTHALTRLAQAVAASDPELAEQIAATFQDSASHAWLLISLVPMVAINSPDRVPELALAAEQSARTLAHPYAQAEALATLAHAIAHLQPDRARDIARVADQVTLTIADPSARAWAMGRLAKAVVILDQEWAQAIAATIADPHAHALALIGMLPAVMARDPSRGRRMAEAAEQAARAMAEPPAQAQTLTRLVQAVAAFDLRRAERIAATLTDPLAQAWASISLAQAALAVNKERGMELAGSAKRIADTIEDVSARSQALTRLVQAVAVSNREWAERLARRIDEPAARARALTYVAQIVAAGEPERARSLAVIVEQVGRSITDAYAHSQALAGLLPAVAADDRTRLDALADRAERVARTITDPSTLTQALTGLVPAIAVRDPDRAERIARTISDPYARSQAMAGLVPAVAKREPSAEQVGADGELLQSNEELAEKIALEIRDPYAQAQALTGLSAAVAGSDVDRAERAALTAKQTIRTIADPYVQARALTDLSQAVALTDPSWAVAVANGISDRYARAQALTRLVPAVAAENPEWAEHIAFTITDPYAKAQALANLVQAIANTDPERADRIISSITDRSDQAQASASLVPAIAPTDPYRADQIVRDITDLSAQVRALASLVPIVFETDPERARQIARTAERIAGDISDPDAQADALVRLVEAAATTDRDWAERIAVGIVDAAVRATVLLALADFAHRSGWGRERRNHLVAEAILAGAGSYRAILAAEPEDRNAGIDDLLGELAT
jgi:hypothetical protein